MVLLAAAVLCSLRLVIACSWMSSPVFARDYFSATVHVCLLGLVMIWCFSLDFVDRLYCDIGGRLGLVVEDICLILMFLPQIGLKF